MTMNELEKEIDEKCGEYSTIEYAKCFEAGCNFILEKNLPVLFAEWLLDENDLAYIGSKSADQHFNYWLNNVYGKENFRRGKRKTI